MVPVTNTGRNASCLRAPCGSRGIMYIDMDHHPVYLPYSGFRDPREGEDVGICKE